MSIRKLQKRRLSSTIGFVIAASTVPWVATAGDLQIEEIVVTAQKRAESAQDIPVAITAVDSETLDNMGIQNFNDLTRISPSLTIQGSSNKNNSPISMRGIGTLAYGMGIEPSVTVIVDDVPVARSAQAFSNLSDIERVEVLRGPQSTLFGKSASAGVISITTRAPSQEPEASFEITTTDDNEQRFSGAASATIAENLGVRVSGYYSDIEGNVKNLYDGNMLNGGISKGLRSKLTWDTSDVFTMTLIADYNESDDDCCAGPLQYVAADAKGLGFIPQSFFLEGITPSRTNTDVLQDLTPKSISRDWSTTLKAELNIGEHTLTSITGYRDWRYRFAQDVDGTAHAFAVNQFSLNNTELLTQELRLSSPVSESFDYIAGLYYSKYDHYREFERSPVFVALWEATAVNESYAAFAQAKWAFSEQLNLIGGLRYNTEEISTTFDKSSVTPNEHFAGSDTDDVVTGKLALQYFVNDEMMLFAGFSRGYKGQGYDITSSFSQDAADKPVAPETSDAFELGLKSTLLDGRVQLNAVLFTSEYSDFQAQSTVTDPVTQALEFKLNNVGDLETAGLEIDAIALISENLRINLGIAYIDAQIKEFKNADCYSLQTAMEPGTCVAEKQDLSGEELNNSPDFKLTLGGEYLLPLASMPFDGFANFSYQWQDDVNFSLLANPIATQDAYGIFNLSVGINAKDENYKVTLFVNNLFDKGYVTSVGQAQGFFGGADVRTQQVPRGAERYAGLRLKMNF